MRQPVHLFRSATTMLSSQLLIAAPLMACLLGVTVTTAAANPLQPIFSSDAIGLVDRIEVKTENAVEGDCWTNTAAVHDSVAQILRASDIVVRDGDSVNQPNRATLLLEAVGVRGKTSQCYGSFRASVYRWHHLEIDKFLLPSKIVYLGTMSVVSSPNTLNGLIAKYAEDFARDLTHRMLKARHEPAVKAARALLYFD